MKSTGAVRISEDYSDTVATNIAGKVDKYPIPNATEMFTRLACGTVCIMTEMFTRLACGTVCIMTEMFTRLACGTVCIMLGMSHAYQQFVLDEESHPLTTINTSERIFEFERLPFGVSSSPGIFQRIMYQLLQNIPVTVVDLDDILVTGKTHTKSTIVIWLQCQRVCNTQGLFIAFIYPG